MDYLLKTVTYGAINKTDTKTMGYYIIKYVSGIFKLQEDTTIYNQVSKPGNISAKATHLSEILKKKVLGTGTT